MSDQPRPLTPEQSRDIPGMTTPEVEAAERAVDGTCDFFALSSHGNAYAKANGHLSRCVACGRFQWQHWLKNALRERHALRAQPPPAQPAERERLIDGDTSDGFHTFNELYDYRKAFNALLFNEWARQGMFDVHKSRNHSDGEPCFGGGWFIVVAQLPTGQISNHYKLDDWDLFTLPERECGAPWDGHTPAIALARMFEALRAAPPASLHPERREP